MFKTNLNIKIIENSIEKYLKELFLPPFWYVNKSAIRKVMMRS